MRIDIKDAYAKLNRSNANVGGTDGSKTTGAAASRSKDAAQGTATSAVGSAASSTSTTVTVSTKARELAALAAPSEAKVAALRERIAQGDLKIDARSIASKLLGDDA